ncbi:MAG: DNA translocase FtsK [Candidatus Paceibacterota bacterium]|nr:MAG: DNA translocase FtsK [Candidatus Paceibacterota bacterium]
MARQSNGKKREKPSDEGGSSLFDISQETRNSIWGILSFITAIVVTLSFLGRAGSAGELIDSVSRLLFGWGYILVPISFALLGISFIKSLSRHIATSAVVGTITFVLSTLAILHILGDGTFDDRIIQGGYLGVVLGFPLLSSVGFVASLIVLLSFLSISILLALNVPLSALFMRAPEEEAAPQEDEIVIRNAQKELAQKPAPALAEVKQAAPPKEKASKVDDAPEKGFVIKNLKLGKWNLPPLKLLSEDQDQALTGDIQANANIIKRTLANFGIEVEMGEVSIGPTVTQFTMRPAVGVRLSKISALGPDLALALAAHPIRIEAPIPGKSLVGIEVPNKKTAIVGLRNLLEADEYARGKAFLPLAIGRDVGGLSVYGSLERMPHLLVAGATGTGKSVMVNGILLSLLYKHSPETLKLILVDPKRVELSIYNDIPHLITPVITDTKKVMGALKWAVSEMDRRYDQLSKVGSRDLFSYNTKMVAEGKDIMPFIVIVIDEMADLMASFGRDVEAAIVRLAQMSRAVGIHLILSTQRPSVEVITGLIKANITSRIALQVASQIDSRTIIDMAGAEKLLGRGDLLFMSGDAAKLRRVQAPLVTEKEVHDVVAFLREQAEELNLSQNESLSSELTNSLANGGPQGQGGDNGSDEDDLYDEAKRIVIDSGKASASLLQRRLRVGYARAARLLDILEDKGIIGPGEGAKPREVYVQADGAPSAPPMGYAPVATAVSADTLEAERDEQ